MRNGLSLVACAVAGAVALVSSSVRASAIVSLLGDSGTLTVETYSPPTISSVTLSDPYGAPPLPTIVPITNGFALTFVPTAQFLATANSFSGGKTTTMDGKLDLLITFSSPVQLTTNVYEDGIYSKTGTGTVNASGGVVVSEADHVIPTQTVGNSFPGATYNASGTWSIFDQATGFTSSFSNYKVSIDNTLIAEALATQGTGTSYIAKKDFTLVFTTDGSSGSGQSPQTPEPASLGVLALGGIALLARRRK
jgi:hypothetical protein